MKNLITVRGIGMTRHPTDEFIVLDIYISGLVNSKIEVIKIITEVHLVCNLKTKLLIGVDVLDSEEMNMSFHNCSLMINGEEGWKTSIHIHAKNNT
jgi:hypothetical protein